MEENTTSKKTLKDRYESVKEWAGDHIEEITIGCYVAFMAVIFGESVRTMRITRKQAELEYAKSAIELFKQT